MTQIRRNIFFTLLGLIALASAATASARGPGFETPPPFQAARPVVYVTSQGLAYDSFVLGTLPPKGRFQKLEMGGLTGLQTEFGPGNPGYLGGRWWMDVNGNNEMDDEDVYFLCPLLAPGYAP
jgi:hypothetical protein